MKKGLREDFIKAGKLRIGRSHETVFISNHEAIMKNKQCPNRGEGLDSLNVDQ